jgi:serine protease
MATMTSRVRGRACSILGGGVLAVALVAVAFVAAGHTQQLELGGRSRVMVSDTGLPGIDRGLITQDPPKEPFGRGTRGLQAASRATRTTNADSPYVPGAVIVKFKTGTDTGGVNSVMRTVDGTHISRPSYANFDLIEIPLDADAEAIAADLRNQPEVQYAQPRYRNHPMLRPNDPMYSQQWNFPQLDMERAWDIQPAAGSDVTVAVLDTGVAFRTSTIRYNSTFPWRLTSTSPVFPPLGVVDVPFAVAPELGDAKFVSPRDFIWDDNLPFDLDGHGTHVSGTIGQLTNNNTGVAGMAFNVKIMPVKVIDEVWDFVFGSPFEGTDDTVARGIRYAADNGANVINLSIGRTEGGPAVVVEDAIRYAVSRGVFVAVAAGNTADTGNAASRTAEFAPSIDGMVAVAAVSRDRARAYYSTTNVYVEIAAPGGDQRQHGLSGGILQQTLDEDTLHTYLNAYRPPRADMFRYLFFQGTSMATPHVSGLAALLIQQGITSPAAIEAAMKQYATDIGRAGVDSEYGAGLINPRATLRGLGLAR